MGKFMQKIIDFFKSLFGKKKDSKDAVKLTIEAGNITTKNI